MGFWTSVRLDWTCDAGSVFENHEPYSPRTLTVIVLLAVVFSLLASAGTGTQEAFQFLTTANTVCYGVYYLLMFAVPLVAGTRFSPRPTSDLVSSFASPASVALRSRC